MRPACATLSQLAFFRESCQKFPWVKFLQVQLVKELLLKVLLQGLARLLRQRRLKWHSPTDLWLCVWNRELFEATCQGCTHTSYSARCTVHLLSYVCTCGCSSLYSPRALFCVYMWMYFVVDVVVVWPSNAAHRPTAIWRRFHFFFSSFFFFLFFFFLWTVPWWDSYLTVNSQDDNIRAKLDSSNHT